METYKEEKSVVSYKAQVRRGGFTLQTNAGIGLARIKEQVLSYDAISPEPTKVHWELRLPTSANIFSVIVLRVFPHININQIRGSN